MKKSIKILIAVLTVLIILIAVAIFTANNLLRQPLPDYDGTVSLNGISAPVNIFRTENAIPYILAEKEEDAAYALGYVHAQERMFQMDVTRRAGEGRLSEIFGTKTIAVDKMFKTVGLYRAALEQYEKLNPLTKKIYSAYAEGINSYLKERTGKLSIEFDVLGYEPYEWIPEHSFVIAKLMAWELNISWWTDISFTHLIQKFGEEKVKEILPDFPENAPTIIPPNIKRFADVSTDFIKADRDYRKFFGINGTHLGSNNWVVNGNKSESGKPIIANDPHLVLRSPAKWYMAVIRSDNWNVEGFTLPGLPGVVIGKNETIAWVITNVMADDADFYVEELDSSKTKYLLDGKWNELETYKEEIIVKDSANVIYDVYKTHRGPIISDVYKVDFKSDKMPESDAVISMRWTALDFSDELYSMLNVNRSTNWKEFDAALEEYTVPGQNFVYADTSGNIGYICAAKLPRRKNVSPTFVYDGTVSESDWIGYVPYKQMPKIYNPKNNFIASANNKTVKSFKHHISNLWEPASRIERINILLNSKEKHSVEDFKKYQNDFYSPYAEKIIAEISKAFENVTINDNNLKLTLELFEKWNFEMDRYSQAPAIYSVFMQKLIKNIFEDEMGRELLEEYIFMANVPMRVIPVLLKEGSSTWFDNVSTEAIESKNDIVRNSLADALKELENQFGNNIANWQWGELHTMTFEHFFSGVSSFVDKLVNIGPYPIGGDGTTVFLTEYQLGESYNVAVGPSLRFIYDFSKPDEFEFILPTGQSGHIMSDHYSDMTDFWLKGKYLKLNLNMEKVKAESPHLLTLNPLN